MSDGAVEHGELITPGGLPEDAPATPEPENDGEYVSEPAKVMRVGSMIKQLLDEVRSTSLDEPSRQRLRAIYDTSIEELGSALSPDLRDELQRLAFPFAENGTPSEVELRVAQAQLVGWLEGLFHGIQATLFAQQMAARQQLENMRGQLPPGMLPPGAGGPAGPGGPGGPGGPVPPEDRPGTYL
ncbi:MAG TPA: bacterial proteasome activator family protein [Acidimicrobiales bacterium]